MTKRIKNHEKTIGNLKTVLSIIGSIVVGLIIGFILAFAFLIRSTFLLLIAILIFVFGSIVVTTYSDKHFASLALILISIVIGGLLTNALLRSYILGLYYNVPLLVFYPNHPNITVIQNCSKIETSVLGYINGQPIKPESVTYCYLPANVSQDSNPFYCSIIGRNISCVTIANDENITWNGVILNITKIK